MKKYPQVIRIDPVSQIKKIPVDNPAAIIFPSKAEYIWIRPRCNNNKKTNFILRRSRRISGYGYYVRRHSLNRFVTNIDKNID